MDMIRKIIAWIVGLFSVEDRIVVVNDSGHGDTTDTVIEENDWKVNSEVVNVDSNCLKVVYREKYGDEIVEYCMVVFENDKTQQYKLIAPWLKNVVIERSNITGIVVSEISRGEIPKVERAE